MPPLAAALVSWLAISTAMAYVMIATVVLSAGMAVYGSAQARRAERKARDDLNASMKDRMVTRIATETPHRYIYGRAKVGADIVAMFTSGPKDEYKHLVCVHAAHECDAIEEIYVNNVLVTGLDAFGDPTSGRFATDPDMLVAEEAHTGPNITVSRLPREGTVKAFSGSNSQMVTVNVLSQIGRAVTVDFTGPVTVIYEYAAVQKFGTDISVDTPPATTPVVRVQKHLGGASDAADTYLRSVVGDKWPATAVLRGFCYTVITLDLNHPEFQGGLVPIHAVIRGRKLYDPRTGTKVWSQNAALATMDYLTSPLCGVPMTDLPTAQFIAAANVCDEVAFIIPVPAGRYTINGTVTSDQNQSTVLEAMAQAMAGSLVSTTWDIYAGKYIAPVAALTQEDIVGGLSVTPGVSDAGVYNGVKGQYIGPENNHVQTDFKPYQNAVYRVSDGRDLYTNIDFPFTDNVQRVTNLARIFTEDQRNSFTIKAEFSLKAWPMKVGQRITFTSATLGQTAKIYRITDKSYSPNSAVQLTLKEDDASIWDFADAVVVDSTPNSDLPDPWKVNPLASIACTSGEATLLRQPDGSMVPRILVSWPADPTHQIGTQIEVEWRAVSSQTWHRTSVSANETQVYLSPITPGYFYVIRARRFNPYINTGSRWITTTYQVQVFTARPRVYKWSVAMPATPTGATTYNWATMDYASPADWSKSITAAPGGGMTSWTAEVLVADISVNAPTPFNWADAKVFTIGFEETPGSGNYTWIKYATSDTGANMSDSATGMSYIGLAFNRTTATESTNPADYSWSLFKGDPGTKHAVAYLYQWSTAIPAKPTGTSSFGWAASANTGYSASDGWAAVAASNPGTPLIKLFVAAVAVTDTAGATSTAVSYTNSTVTAWSQNGSNGTNGNHGIQAATPTVYLWAATIPAGPSGAATLTWATGAFGAAPAGWALTPGASPSPGFTLWAAKVAVTDTAANTTTNFNWTTAAITAQSYAGTNGTPGTEGASYVTAYCASATTSTTTAPAATTGKTSLPAVDSGGIVGTYTSTVPALTSGQFMYQTDGIYNPVTNQIIWSIPYWSSIKVAVLSAITANLGNINAGSIDLGAGKILLNNDGSARFRAVTVETAAGDTILASGVPLNPAYAAPGTLNNDLTASINSAATTAQWANVGGVGKPADNASSDITFAVSGVVVSGNSITKTSGVANAWDAHAMTPYGYAGGAFVSARPANLCYMAFGLNTDPGADASINSLDYAIEFTPAGDVQYFENGAVGSIISTYTPGVDTFTLKYDGSRFIYEKNGATIRTVTPASPITAPLHFDSSFYTMGGQLSGVRFGPMTSVADKLNKNATDFLNAPIVLQANGAIQVGTATYVNGVLSGTGVTVTPYGLAVVKNGVAQITMNNAGEITAIDLSTMSARIGTLRTATSGARIEIKDNVLEGYRSNNTRSWRLT